MNERLRSADHMMVGAVMQQVSWGLSNEAVILNLQNGAYYGLDPVGARHWELSQQPRPVEEIRLLLCTQDLEKLLQELFSHGLLETHDGTPAQALSPPTD